MDYEQGCRSAASWDPAALEETATAAAVLALAASDEMAQLLAVVVDLSVAVVLGVPVTAAGTVAVVAMGILSALKRVVSAAAMAVAAALAAAMVTVGLHRSSSLSEATFAVVVVQGATAVQQTTPLVHQALWTLPCVSQPVVVSAATP